MINISISSNNYCLKMYMLCCYYIISSHTRLLLVSICILYFYFKHSVSLRFRCILLTAHRWAFKLQSDTDLLEIPALFIFTFLNKIHLVWLVIYFDLNLIPYFVLKSSLPLIFFKFCSLPFSPLPPPPIFFNERRSLSILKIIPFWGTWVAQLVERPASAQVMI